MNQQILIDEIGKNVSFYNKNNDVVISNKQIKMLEFAQGNDLQSTVAIVHPKQNKIIRCVFYEYAFHGQVMFIKNNTKLNRLSENILHSVLCVDKSIEASLRDWNVADFSMSVGSVDNETLVNLEKQMLSKEIIEVSLENVKDLCRVAEHLTKLRKKYREVEKKEADKKLSTLELTEQNCIELFNK